MSGVSGVFCSAFWALKQDWDSDVHHEGPVRQPGDVVQHHQVAVFVESRLCEQ